MGAPKSGKKRGRGTERAKMAVAVSKAKFLKLRMIPNITTVTLQNVVDQYVQKGATIECDRSYPRLENVTVDASSNR